MKRYLQKNTGKLITYALLIIGAYVMVVPFFWMFSTSFKTLVESTRIPIQWLPDALYLGNYQRILEMNIGKYYQNTIIVTVCITLAQLITSSMAAYAFARIKFPGRDVLFLLVLAMLMIPAQMTLIPKFSMVIRLNLFDSLAGIIIPSVTSVTITFFMRQFFLTLPTELEDAARIDGCSHFRIFWNIALPLSTSVIAAMAVLVALYAWNDLLWPVVVTSTDKTRVLSVFIAAMRGETNIQIPLMMAAGTLSVVPMILVFIAGQKYFVTAITMTGLKD